VGERVNKIRFVGSINKEIRLESVTLSDLLGKERNARVKEKRRRESCDFASKPGKGETNNSVILINMILMIN